MTSTARSESLAVHGSNSRDSSSRDSSSREEAGGLGPAAGPSLRAAAPNRVIVALCIYAALRILVFAVAFPLFNNTDEKFHLMSIQMYAQGRLPGKELPLVDDEFSRTFLPYLSPEYEISREDIDRDGVEMPLYRIPDRARESTLAEPYYAVKLKKWSRTANFEAQGAPLYYVVGAVWYKLGTILGLHDWGVAYWVRLLNPIAYALLVWLSYRFVRQIYPERKFLWLAVPALIAVFPQDVFFGMNRDVLSAPVCAAALLFMALALTAETDRYRYLILASVLVGLAFTTEVSNFVFYIPWLATLWQWVRRSPSPGQRKFWVASACAAAALLTPSLWMLRNYLVMGDLAGSKAKLSDFGWTVRPLGMFFQHQLFSWDGLSYFLVNLTRTFWHGEYRWYGLPMRNPGADWFYVLSSFILIVIFLTDFMLRQRALPDISRWAGSQAFILVLSSALFLAVISLMFDFHDFPYPSRIHPYFVSGRIMSGALLPFIFIYVSGLQIVANRLRKWVPPAAVLACLLLFITVSEIHVRSVAFSSPYNFFALSGWQR
jgi:hypothetical protein